MCLEKGTIWSVNEFHHKYLPRKKVDTLGSKMSPRRALDLHITESTLLPKNVKTLKRFSWHHSLFFALLKNNISDRVVSFSRHTHTDHSTYRTPCTFRYSRSNWNLLSVRTNFSGMINSPKLLVHIQLNFQGVTEARISSWETISWRRHLSNERGDAIHERRRRTNIFFSISGWIPARN